VTSTAVEML